MPAPEASPGPARGLDRVELILFVFGVLAIAFIMLAFGQPLAGETYLPVVAVWLVGGLGFVWWFHRHLAAAAKPPRRKAKLTRISSSSSSSSSRRRPSRG